MTNPIWFVKTRLQLDQSKYGTQTAWMCIKSVYRHKGIIGFYKGITASYFGISETIIHFVIYEYLKNQFKQTHLKMYPVPEQKTEDYQKSYHFFQIMLAGSISKTCASIIAYPHGKLSLRDLFFLSQPSLKNSKSHA